MLDLSDPPITLASHRDQRSRTPPVASIVVKGEKDHAEVRNGAVPTSADS
jgi:hypothetical protein